MVLGLYYRCLFEILRVGLTCILSSFTLQNNFILEVITLQVSVRDLKTYDSIELNFSLSLALSKGGGYN